MTPNPSAKIFDIETVAGHRRPARTAARPSGRRSSDSDVARIRVSRAAGAPQNGPTKFISRPLCISTGVVAIRLGRPLPPCRENEDFVFAAGPLGQAPKKAEGRAHPRPAFVSTAIWGDNTPRSYRGTAAASTFLCLPYNTASLVFHGVSANRAYWNSATMIRELQVQPLLARYPTGGHVRPENVLAGS